MLIIIFIAKWLLGAICSRSNKKWDTKCSLVSDLELITNHGDALPNGLEIKILVWVRQIVVRVRQESFDFTLLESV